MVSWKFEDTTLWRPQDNNCLVRPTLKTIWLKSIHTFNKKDQSHIIQICAKLVFVNFIPKAKHSRVKKNNKKSGSNSMPATIQAQRHYIQPQPSTCCSPCALFIKSNLSEGTTEASYVVKLNGDWLCSLKTESHHDANFAIRVKCRYNAVQNSKILH